MTHGRRCNGRIVISLVAAWALSALALAGETVIYKSTDAQGKVSYGDKPARNAAMVEEIRLPGSAAVSPAATQAGIEALAATTDRLRADRLDREKERAAAAPPPPVEPQLSPHPEIYPQYRTYPGPLAWPAPFRERRRHHQDVPYGWDDDWRLPRPSRPPVHHGHLRQRSPLRNPDR